MPKRTLDPLPSAAFQILLALVGEDLHGYAIMRQVAEQTGNRYLAGQATTALANAELAAGQASQALATARRALAIHHETGHLAGQAHTHLLIARALDQVDEPDAAREHREQARARYASMSWPEADRRTRCSPGPSVSTHTDHRTAS